MKYFFYVLAMIILSAYGVLQADNKGIDVNIHINNDPKGYLGDVLLINVTVKNNTSDDISFVEFANSLRGQNYQLFLKKDTERDYIQLDVENEPAGESRGSSKMRSFRLPDFWEVKSGKARKAVLIARLGMADSANEYLKSNTKYNVKLKLLLLTQAAEKVKSLRIGTNCKWIETNVSTYEIGEINKKDLLAWEGLKSSGRPAFIYWPGKIETKKANELLKITKNTIYEKPTSYSVVYSKFNDAVEMDYRKKPDMKQMKLWANEIKEASEDKDLSMGWRLLMSRRYQNMQSYIDKVEKKK